MVTPETNPTSLRPRRLHLAALVGSLALGLLHGSDVRAASFTVTKTADTQATCTPSSCSLREAIAAANALTTEASTITLPAGTYVLTIARTLTLSADITITGAGSATTIVDGNLSVRVFDNPANSVQIGGVTVRNGKDGSGVGGGGIHNVGTFTGTDVVLDSNTTNGQGGGLFNDQGIAYLTQSVLRKNKAATGGGVANTGSISFLGSFTIDGNTSTAEGGGVWNNSLASLDNSNPPVPPGPPTGGGTISSNVSGKSGGGIYNTGGFVSLMNVALDGNSASVDGAGYWNGGGEVDVLNGTISRSVAGRNGAGCWNDGSTILTNVTLAANSTSAGQGGALWNSLNFAYALLDNCTVAGNSAHTGGGTFNSTSSTSSGTVEVQNTIFASNTPANCSGGISSDGNNIDSGSSCTPRVTSDRANTNPLLGALQYNPPGPTFLQTQALLSGSPAINAAANCPPPDTDERGVTRPQGAACDVGAFEVAVATSTTTTTTTRPTTTTTTSSTTTTTIACGDVNGDGAVNIADALLTAQYDVGLRPCGQAPFGHPQVCDVNSDAACNIGDALRMAQCDVGLVSCVFSCRPFTCP